MWISRAAVTASILPSNLAGEGAESFLAGAATSAHAPPRYPQTARPRSVSRCLNPPPALSVSCVYFSLFGSGFAGLFIPSRARSSAMRTLAMALRAGAPRSANTADIATFDRGLRMHVDMDHRPVISLSSPQDYIRPGGRCSFIAGLNSHSEGSGVHRVIGTSWRDFLWGQAKCHAPHRTASLYRSRRRPRQYLGAGRRRHISFSDYAVTAKCPPLRMHTPAKFGMFMKDLA